MSLRGTEYGSTIYTRAEWGARAPRSTSGIPAVEMTTVHYAGPSDWGSGVDRSTPERFFATTDHNRCPSIMRSHQNFHMDSRGWSDYAYNGSACPHGYGFIGRGRGVRSAAQGTTDGNNRSYAIQYLGAGTNGGREDPLTEQAKRAFYDMAAYLGMPLRRGHRDWKSTSCPGEPTYAWRLAGFPRPLGNGADDMQADERIWLKTIYDHIHTNKGAVQAQTVWGAIAPPSNSTALGALGEIFFNVRDIKATVNQPVDVDEEAIAEAVATAVIAALPGGGTSIDFELVKSAVKQGFAELVAA